MKDNVSNPAVPEDKNKAATNKYRSVGQKSTNIPHRVDVISRNNYQNAT
jgi:hypothetical protein